MRRRLLDIGLIENTDVECIGTSPGGDPSAVPIRGCGLAIRSEDCSGILIEARERGISGGSDKQLDRPEGRGFGPGNQKTERGR